MYAMIILFNEKHKHTDKKNGKAREKSNSCYSCDFGGMVSFFFLQAASFYLFIYCYRLHFFKIGG